MSGAEAVHDGSASERGGSLVDALRDAITSGRLQPNERLVESELSERYGVSRATIRPALLELEKEGLVERPQHRGARVRSFTRQEAVEILEARQVNEGLCAAKAAERAGPAEVAELQELIGQMRAAVSAGDYFGYSELNRRLHQTVRSASRHGTAAEIVGRLRNQIVRHQFRIAFYPGRPDVSLREHEAIVDAIAAGDAERARAAMQDHLQSVIDVVANQPAETW